MNSRVVFDTNILFSAVGWRGTPYRCVELARAGSIDSFTCDDILDELSEKLVAKRSMALGDARRVCSEIAAFSTKVAIEGILKVVTDDPDDDKVIECAVVANAGYIVSGDRHLLSIMAYGSIQIVS